jgi:Domain of unknown function (DUF4214)
MRRHLATATRTVPLQVEALEDRVVLSSAAYVTALYQDLLHRTPAPSEGAGYVHALDSGTSAATVALLFTGSLEFQTKEVQSDYAVFLGRQASVAEVGGWVGALQAGVSENQVETAFLASDEYFSHHGGAPAPWLEGIYHDVLGRQADPGGLTSWALVLENGASRQQVALDIVTSAEAETGLATAAYFNLLQRLPDPAGLAGWVTALQHGLRPSGLLAALASSDEYIQLRAPGGLDNPPVSPTAPDNGSVPSDGSQPVCIDPIVVDPGVPVTTPYDPGTGGGFADAPTAGTDNSDSTPSDSGTGGGFDNSSSDGTDWC